VGRIFIENEIYLYSSVALMGIFALFVKMPVDTNIFKHGKELNQLTTAFYKNSISMGSKFIFYVILFGLFYFLDEFNLLQSF